MKKTNLIKLLSVLLCMVLLFTSCDSKNDPEETAETTTQTEATTPAETPSEPVEAVLENFFTILPDDDATVALKDATRLEGELVSKSSDGQFVVFRTATLDFTNTVTETFNVYNARLDKTVATFTNSYKYASAEFDWNDMTIEDDSVPYQENALSVTIKSAEFFSGLYWVEVKRAELTLIDEEVREENEDGYVYDVKTSYEYYDVTGQLIAKSGMKLDPAILTPMFRLEEVGFRFGNVKAYFDFETHEMVNRIEGDGADHVPTYDVKNEKYGYVFGVQAAAIESFVDTVEVYDISTGEKLFKYYFDYAEYELAYDVLENGNIFFQLVNYAAEGEQYDFYSEYYGNLTVDTYILDVETQKVKEIDCGFVINRVIQKDIWNLYKRFFDGLEIDLTENVLNLAVIQRIKDKNVEKQEIVCLDNELGIMFAMAPIVPEHRFSMDEYETIPDFGFEILPNGDYLVDLYNVVTPQAIVKKDGTVRSYLKADDKIAGDYVVNAKGIFDYDGKELYAFDEDTEWTFVEAFANNIIVSRENEVYAPEADPEVDDPEEIITEYYILKNTNGLFASTRVFEDQTIVKADDVYLITQNDENGKYTIYNVNMEHVLTTANEVSVYEFDGKYVAITEIDGTLLYYTLK